MNRICWFLVDVLSRTLEPDERDVVRGDFAESGAAGREALCDLISLVILRQVNLWKDWRPWLALLGLVGIAGVFLSEICFRLDAALGSQLSAYSRYGVHFDTGLTIGEDIVYLVCLSVALFAWSWASGFVLGSLSGRAIWLTGVLFYVVVLNSRPAILVLSGNTKIPSPQLSRMILGATLPLSISRVLFLLAAFWGTRGGLRLRTLRLRHTLIVAAAIAILTSLVAWTSGWYETAHEIWSEGVWRAVPWQRRLPPLVLLSWPIGYMLATSWRCGRGAIYRENNT